MCCRHFWPFRWMCFWDWSMMLVSVIFKFIDMVGSEWLDGKFRYMFSYLRSCQDFSKHCQNIVWDLLCFVPCQCLQICLVRIFTVLLSIPLFLAVICFPLVTHDVKNFCFLLIIHTCIFQSLVKLCLSHSIFYFALVQSWAKKIEVYCILSGKAFASLFSHTVASALGFLLAFW